MTNSKKNLKLNWPKSLSEITLKNLNMTELWFLRNTIDSGTGDVRPPNFGQLTIRDSKFAYDECYIDIEDQRYLIKHKTWVSGEVMASIRNNVVFYVRKHKNLIGK